MPVRALPAIPRRSLGGEYSNLKWTLNVWDEDSKYNVIWSAYKVGFGKFSAAYRGGRYAASIATQKRTLNAWGRRLKI